MRIPLLVFVVALSCGCATSPPPPAATGAAPVASVTNGTTPAEKRFHAPAGYKAKTRNGQTVYCKNIATTGSRFETETCMTDAELRQLEQQADADRQMFRKNQTICAGGSCGGG